MFNIIGHLRQMSFDFPILNSLHFEHDFLFCVNDGVFGYFSWVLFGSFKCVIVSTAFLVEIYAICAMSFIL